MHRPAASTRLAANALGEAGKGRFARGLANAGEAGAANALDEAGKGRFARSFASAGEAGAANALGEAGKGRFARGLAGAGEAGAANALGEAGEDRFARNSLFRLAAAWRACPKAEASLPDDGAGPLFEAAAENEPVAVPVARAVPGRSSSR